MSLATDPLTDGDTSVAAVYRLTDSSGGIWRSSPYILPNCLYWQGPTYDSLIRIPTLRHLMAGTVAEIELYIGQVDLQLFAVYPNDPTVNFVDVHPGRVVELGRPYYGKVAWAVAAAGIGETLYTTGGALPNASPPIARCAYNWRNRAFVANGNTIWPSQEFSEGLGVAWNETTRINWEEGTGDILAIAHIDWNYLAVFKVDAIGIISGPGPDGNGHGNYIVQTLSTKAGCTNVKSIVNGADGCYYQDSQTGRLMLLAPTLQVQEAAPGAFDFSGYALTCGLHVEAARQMWWYASLNGGSGPMIVLDYKHRTQSCPCGSVYTWEAPFQVSAMEILHGVPTLLSRTGAEAAQVVGQVYDQDTAGTQTPILQSFITGDANPLGLQRQFDLDRVQVLGEYVSPHTLSVTVAVDFGAASSTTATCTMSAAPEQMMTRPDNCMRIQAARLTVQEGVVYTGTPPVPILGPGLKFVGFALVVADYGKISDLSTGRII
jgi:hypothetical protein